MDNLDQVFYPFTSELIMCTLDALIFFQTVAMGEERIAKSKAKKAAEKATATNELQKAASARNRLEGADSLISSPAQRPKGMGTLRVGGGSGGGSGGGTANLTTGGGTSGAQRRSMKVRPTGRYA